MAKSLEKRIIDERSYSFGRHSPLKSVALLMKITKLLGTSLKNGFSMGSENKGLFDSDINIGTIISNLCEKLDTKTFNELAVEILSQTLFNSTEEGKGGLINSEEKIEIVFMDTDVGHLFAVLKEALDVEYKGFFYERLGLSALIKSIKEKKKSMNLEKSTLTGSNGDQS